MNIKQKVFGDPGYSTDLCLTDDELSFFQKAVYNQWIERIGEKYPSLRERFAKEGLQNYHLLSDQLDTEMLWGKQYRLLPQDIVNTIKKFPFMDQLKANFGDFSISNVIYDNKLGKGEEIYWRLVRPKRASDVGPMHTDKWFHQLVGEYGMFPEGAQTVKVWVAIYTEPGLNGLIVVPNSHTKNWRYKVVEKNGIPKPCLDEEVKDGLLVPVKPGTLLIFNERLLHGGAINQSNTTRISAEITMVFQGSG